MGSRSRRPRLGGSSGISKMGISELKINKFGESGESKEARYRININRNSSITFRDGNK